MDTSYPPAPPSTVTSHDLQPMGPAMNIIKGVGLDSKFDFDRGCFFLDVSDPVSGLARHLLVRFGFTVDCSSEVEYPQLGASRVALRLDLSLSHPCKSA